MLRLFLIASFALAGCAGAKSGGWPSLMTPEEKRGSGQAAAAPAPPPPVPAPAEQPRPAQASPELAAAASRLAEERRNLENAVQRFKAQLAAFEAAAAKAQGAKPQSVAWSEAQRELTRLNQTAGAFDELRTAVNGAAGQLAVAAAGGVDVADPLADAGRLLRRIEAAQTQANEATAASAKRLQR